MTLKRFDLKWILLGALRILLGVIFIFSGIVKLFPIEPFEILITDAGIAGWQFAPFIARLIVSVEVFLGLLLILNIFPRFCLWSSIVMLSGFTLYLFAVMLFRKDIEDCGCFGSLVKLSPWQSVIKNLALTGIAIFLLVTRRPWRKKFIKWIALIALIGSIILPFALVTPDIFFDYSRRQEHVGTRLELEKLGDFMFSDGLHRPDTGRVVLCFFSQKCRFCRYSATKIAVLQRESSQKLNVLFVFPEFSDSTALRRFHDLTKSSGIPYKIIDPEPFSEMAGRSLPAVYFLENGIIMHESGYRDMDPDALKAFLLH